MTTPVTPSTSLDALEVKLQKELNTALDTKLNNLETKLQTQLASILDALNTQSVTPAPIPFVPNEGIISTKDLTKLAASISTSPMESSSKVLQSTIKDLEAKNKELTAQNTQLTTQVASLTEQVKDLTTKLDSLLSKLEGGSGDSNGSDTSGDGASTPVTPDSTPPQISPKNSSVPPEITALEPYRGEVPKDTIVTADLESMIDPETGQNLVYMAAWYNGKNHKIYDLTQYDYKSNYMLSEFWFDLINQNKGSTVYFHNWAGYDSILSLKPLLSLHNHGFTFLPLIQNGQLLSLTVNGGKSLLITIKDSLKIIPGALAKLAQDFQVDTQKDHFPHYFWVNNIQSTLSYVGDIPEYKYFEPKRTSNVDYAAMVQEFQNKPWNFLEVSKKYILGDVIALTRL